MKPNIIVIVSDSLRQDHVSFYANGQCPLKTPNIDALLMDSVSLENMYPHGLPTIPVRTEWVTGAGTLTGRSWQPLSSTDISCAEIMRKEGYITAFITDVYHYFKPDQNFHRGYDEWQWIRGQEYDSYRTALPKKRNVENYWKDSFPETWRNLLNIVCQNLDESEYAKDFPAYKTFERASDWVRKNRNHNQPLFLWVETFDPHEPWTPPKEYDVYGDPDYRGKNYILPPGGNAAKYFSPEEIKRIRSLYAGEVAYVDALVGEFIKTLKEINLYDESLIFFLSDHGHPLADHGKFLKGSDRMHSELLKVPFGFKLSGGKNSGVRLKQMAQFPDVLPTLLDAAGMGNNIPGMQGYSLLPLLRGEKVKIRETTISGYFGSQERSIRNETWSLVLRPDDQPDELYNLVEDPKETKNIIDNNHDIARYLALSFGAAFTGGHVRSKVKGLQGSFEVAGTAAG